MAFQVNAFQVAENAAPLMVRGHLDDVTLAVVGSSDATAMTLGSAGAIANELNDVEATYD